MTRQETQDRIKVMQAYVDGKEIQSRPLTNPEQHWITLEEPVWDWDGYEYRVKEEYDAYLPYRDSQDLLEAIKEKGNLVKEEVFGRPLYMIIISFDDGCIYVPEEEDSEVCYTYREALNRLHWADGTIFGRKAE